MAARIGYPYECHVCREKKWTCFRKMEVSERTILVGICNHMTMPYVGRTPMKRLLLMLPIILLLSSGPANAEWMPVYEINQMATTVSVDPDTIQRKGNLAELWVLYDSKITQAGRGGPLRSTKAQGEFNCEEARSRILAITDFSGNEGTGKVVYSSSGEQEWAPVIPNSLGLTLWKVACNKQ